MPITSTWTPLSVADMGKALLLRHEESSHFSGRNTYVGASEAGGCPRMVAHRKMDPDAYEITDPAAAGRMLMGHVAEAAIVGILRKSHLGPWIRETGANQAEIALEDAPLRTHPDGTIQKLPIPDGLTHALVLDPEGKLVQIAVSELKGAGGLEIKSYGLGAFGALKKNGLSPTYQDQTQVQMGATGRKWTLVVCGCREDVSKVMLFVVLFNPVRFEELKQVARDIMSSVALCVEGSDISAILPAPIAERGYCDRCPLAYECPAHAATSAVAGAEFPEEAALEIEVLADEYVHLSPMVKRLEEVKDALKALYAAHPVEYFITSEGIKTSRRMSGAQERADCKKLKADFPAAYSATVATSTPSLWVAVTPVKGR